MILSVRSMIEEVLRKMMDVLLASIKEHECHANNKIIKMNS